MLLYINQLDRRKTLQRKLLKIFILIPLFFLFECKSDKVVARVGNQTISAEAFKQSFLDDKSFDQAVKMSYSRKLEHLEKMINRRVVLIEAYRQELDRDSSMMKNIGEFEKNLVFQQVINKEIVEKFVSENEIKKEYEKSLKEAKLKHIFYPVNKNATKVEKENLKNSLNELKRKIATGYSFDELARKFSKDSLSAGKGGDLGFVKWGARDFGDNFYKAAFSMKERQLSKPIESDNGIHIVLVEKFRNSKSNLYEDQRDQIRRRLINSKRNELKERSLTFISRLEQRYNVTYYDENNALLLGKIKLEIEDQKKNKQKTLYLRNFSESDKALPLVEYSKGNYTIEKFILEFNKIPPFRRPPIDDVEAIKNYVDRSIPNDLAIIWGYEKGSDKDKRVMEQVKAKKEELMVHKLTQKIQNENQDVTDEDFKVFYLTNSAKYKEPTKYKIREIQVEDYSTVEKVIQLCKTEDFEQLASKYNIRPETQGNGGLLGYISKDQYGRIGAVASTLDIDEISEPIKAGNSYSVIQLLDVREEYLPLFEKMKTKVKSDFEKEFRTNKFEIWQKSLRENIPIAIYNAHLENVLN